MLLDIILRLEKQVDRLLERQRGMEKELRLLRGEKDELLSERERIRAELDRILLKLDSLEEDAS